MKDGKCAKCDGENVYEITEALAPHHKYANSAVPVTLTAHYGPTGESGFLGDKMGQVTVRVSAFVCGTCGYTELYAKDLDRLARMGTKREGNVRPAKAR
jgi:predicted nucleic-acid-binding Zn-ribbon protein